MVAAAMSGGARRLVDHRQRRGRAARGRPIAVGDVDVLMSARDTRRIVPALGVGLTPGVADDRFRSDLFCRWEAPPLGVDFMGGFHFRGEPLIPATRIAIAGVFVPSAASFRRCSNASPGPRISTARGCWRAQSS
jgi:hypothetical protein